MINLISLLITWAATAGLLYFTGLLPGTNGAEVTAADYLAVGTLFFGEMLLFIKGLIRRPAAEGSGAEQADTIFGFVNIAYFMGVLGLFLIYLVGAGITTLAILHIILGLVLLLGWAYVAKAKTTLGRMDRQSTSTG